MIESICDLIEAIKADFSHWDSKTKPWFRGESGNDPPLRPKIAKYEPNHENYVLQSFRRQAGGYANTHMPPRDDTDLWLFLAQHYRVPTRLLDWTEGALHALYFAINMKRDDPKIYMLNARKLNSIAGSKTHPLNYPLSWVKGGSLYVALAWQNRKLDQRQSKQKDDIVLDLDIPLALPATYHDRRMTAQRSCFTIHGEDLRSMQDILKDKGIELSECLYEYNINSEAVTSLMNELTILGISAATIFPDLDHLADDLRADIETDMERGKRIRKEGNLGQDINDSTS